MQKPYYNETAAKFEAMKKARDDKARQRLTRQGRLSMAHNYKSSVVLHINTKTTTGVMIDGALQPLWTNEKQRTERVMMVGGEMFAREDVRAATEDELAALSVFAGVGKGPGAGCGASRRLRRVEKGVVGLNKAFLE